MKRKNNLYEQICKVENIISATNEVCKNTKNKRKTNKFKNYKCIYVSRIYNDINNRNYVVGPYNCFYIYEPKERKIVSQLMYDKVVNHLVARYILMPAIIPKLIDQNFASKAGLGTSKALKYHYKYLKKCTIKYKEFYILKCDISKFFASINQEILKKKVKKVIKDKEALKIVFDIIDSNEEGLGIRQYDFSNIGYLLFKRFRSFYKRKIKNQVLRSLSR